MSLSEIDRKTSRDATSFQGHDVRRRLSIADAMAEPEFLHGFMDGAERSPWFDYADTNKSLQYERGRQFAAHRPDVPRILTGGKVDPFARVAFMRAILDGSIIGG